MGKRWKEKERARRSGWLRRSLCGVAARTRPPEAPGVLLLPEAARMGEVGHFRKHQQIVAPEAVRTLPLIALFVEPREGDVVPGLVFGSVAPNGRFDAPDSDFINGFLVSHDVFPPKELRVCERFPLTREWRKTPKPDPVRGSAGTWRNPDPISVGREVGFGAQPEGCHHSGTTGDLRSMERSDLMRKVARPDV